MTKVNGLVSVVIPTYNCGSVIERAIESVKAQYYPNIEIIVVNDGSTDETNQVVSRYISNPQFNYVKYRTNRGGSAARNVGIAIANGEYIAFLDADDEWKKGKISKQVEKLENSKYSACYCNWELIDQGKYRRLRGFLFKYFLQKDNEAERIEGDDEIIRDILRSSFSLGGASTLLVERDPVLNIGGFDPRFPRHQDWEFMIRLLRRENVELGYIDEKLVTKYKTGYPEPDIIKCSKTMFFNKFSDLITKYENEGWDMYEKHFDYLGIMYLANGEFTTGLKYLGKGSGDRDTMLTALWVSTLALKKSK